MLGLSVLKSLLPSDKQFDYTLTSYQNLIAKCLTTLDQFQKTF